MSDKDDIKDLFQKELGNYQAKVNPNLWNGIQAGLGSTAAAGTASSLGLIGKIVIGVSIAAAVTVGTLLVVNKEDNTPQKDQIISDLKTEDTVSKDDVEPIEIKVDKSDDYLNNETNSVEKEALKDITPDITIKEKIREVPQSNESDFKESKENIDNQLTPQDNKVVPQNRESKVDKKSTPFIDEKTNQSKPIVNETTPKEEFISELDEFNLQIDNKNNQYVAFIAEGVPSHAYVVWDFGDGTIERTLNAEHFYTEAGNYTVKCKVKTEQEEITKTIQVEINILGEIADLPNVFTPNGDGNNDEFFVNCKNIKNFQLTIIDNSQNIIFSTNDIDFRWNGFDKSGQPVKEGTYYYIIVAEDESGNTINKYQQLRLHR